MSEFDYTFGIEEEYFLAARSGNLPGRVPKKVLVHAKKMLGDVVTCELLQSQIEVASPVFRTLEEAQQTMVRLRVSLANLMAEMDLRLIAASTHPMGAWREQVVTEKRRYDELMSDFRIIGQRNLVCGMHVHVGVPSTVDRVVLMNRLMPWLPIFLALSTSSPFWNRHVTGLLSYRQAVYDEWPRSGIPDFFKDEADYQAFVTVLQKGGAAKDGSYLWWAIRPSNNYPTLELRIADVCTRVEDGLALAALYRCLVATLVENPSINATHTTHTRRIIDENRWCAKRDGIQARLIDEGAETAVPLRDAVARLRELVDEQARRLDCIDSLRHIDRILEHGTSAHAQLRRYNDSRAAGETRAKSLKNVIDWLSATTSRDLAALKADAAASIL